MKKFLVDENAGFSIVKYLRNQGFDTKFVSELYPSRNDAFLMKIAFKERRIIVTNDKDFGYLVFKSKLPAVAIILFRFKDESPTLKINTVETILNLPKEKVLNHLIVASENKIRIRSII